MRKTLALMLVSALLAGCGEDLDPASLVDDLRVLAIVADPPEVAAGATTTLDPLVFATDEDVAFEWSVCFLPGPAEAGFVCLDEAAECELGSEASVTLDPVALGTTCLEALLASSDGELTSDDVDSLLSEGTEVMVRLVATSGGESTEAVKNVPVGGEGPYNANPSIAAVLRDGAPWDPDTVIEVASGDAVTLEVQVPEADRETFTDADTGDERTEEIIFAWFATEGEMGGAFTYDASPDNAWTAPDVTAPATDLEVQFWFVARDGRGGSAWTERTARVLAAPVETSE